MPDIKRRPMKYTCWFCDHRDYHPELVVLHIICKHMVAIKRRLFEIADANSMKITEDPALADLINNTVNGEEWENEDLFDETKSSNPSSFNLSDIKNEEVSLPVESIVKEENVSDTNDETYEPKEDEDKNDDEDFKPPKKRGRPKGIRPLDKDGNPIKKKRIYKPKPKRDQEYVKPEVCTYCGTWFHNAFRARQHQCMLKLTKDEGIKVLPTESKDMPHEQICKFCHPFEPGKKKKGKHTCKLCDFVGAQTNLQRHFNNIHLGTVPETCKICGKTTKSMRNHMKQFHVRRDLFKCRYCDYRNFRQTNTQWHMKTKHPEMGHVICDEKGNGTGKCRYLAYSEKQLERHKYYMHEKKEPLPDDLPPAERFFLKHGIPAFPNYQTISDLPKETVIHPCPYPPCHYETISGIALKKHKADYHENFDLEKFMNETV